MNNSLFYTGEVEKLGELQVSVSADPSEKVHFLTFVAGLTLLLQNVCKKKFKISLANFGGGESSTGWLVAFM